MTAFTLPMTYLALAIGMALLVLVVLWHRRRLNRRPASASKRGPASLSQMRTSEFVRLVGLAFEARGYNVVESGVKGARAEGAVDIELRKDREAHLVHCKHWRSRKIDVDAVREFHALMTERRAAGGFIVTTGRFSREAMHYVRGISLSLIDGSLLGPMLDDGRYRKGAATASATMPLDRPKPVEWAPVSVMASVPDAMEDTYDLARQTGGDTRPPPIPPPPSCPLCSAPMLMRTAPEGKHAGRMFWRCSRRRECKGMRPLV
ncbi:MAG: restriction endonuclease [Burkholderiaceae bacterium]|nr:restriction endonuclease [Burkholderiaceae bacterium]